MALCYGEKNMAKKSLSYQDAGVDIDAGNALAAHFTTLLKSTHGPQVIDNDGGFGGLYRLRGIQGLFARRLTDPILVCGADGVGTKLKIAFLLDKHDTVGIDLVAMSVNDILVQGAEPLLFLDYAGTGRVDKRILAAVVSGVAAGCREAGCALLGGETAELPGFYQDGEYDLAGFAVGIVERRRLITGKQIKPGNVIIGLASSGLHSNGFSLARKALLEVGKLALDQRQEDLGCTLGEELLRPTRIYVQPILDVLRAYRVKKPVRGLVHITGGGLVENIPRILPKNCDAEITRNSWTRPPIFDLIQKCGNIETAEMDRVFNQGIGMTLIVSEVSAEAILQRLNQADVAATRIGQITSGTGIVRML